MLVRYFKITVLVDGYLHTDTISTYSREQAIEIVEFINPTAEIIKVVEF
jgi:hypothetical protein